MNAATNPAPSTETLRTTYGLSTEEAYIATHSLAALLRLTVQEERSTMRPGVAS